MSDKALIVRSETGLEFSFSPEAVALKQEGLELAALVFSVGNAEQQQAAVNAQKILATILKQVEDSRKLVKEPVLEFGRKLDAAAKTFSDELKAEQMRLARAVGDFQALEEARIRAAQHAENERLNALERERQAELAKVKSHEEREKVEEAFAQKAVEEAPRIAAPVRVEGQRVTHDWEITIINIHELYRCHANCVDLKPRVSEIKSLLNSGATVRGVAANKIVKATVRAEGPAAALTV